MHFKTLMGSYAIFALCAETAVVSRTSECTRPKGVGTESGDISPSQVHATLKAINAPYLWLPLVDATINALVTNYETPIQFRLALMHGASNYNAVAMHHPTAFDIWGRGHRRLCLEEFASNSAKDAHLQLTSVYAFAYSAITIMPETETNITHVMENVLKLPLSKTDGTPDVGTPWGLAKVFVDEMQEFQQTDGWNANGKLSSEFFSLPYDDFKIVGANGKAYLPYEVQRNTRTRATRGKQTCPKRFLDKDSWEWEPLLESDGHGYFTKQQHVTPFIGFTGRLFGVTESEYNSFKTDAPSYDWCEEANFVVKNTKDLATSDLEKMLVEVYDSKFTSILPFQINWLLQKGVSLFEFWMMDMALVVAMYDATMLVWRDKVHFNSVRPTTVVHAVKNNQIISAWGGPYQGVQQMRGNDWQPYKRTMPHAEYPSGSACVCTTFAKTMSELTGQDATDIPIVHQIPAGSSKVEPKKTPAQNLTLTYNAWSEVAEACGSSRLDGGMHFSKAIEGGEKLCSGIAAAVVERAKRLAAGDAAAAMANFEDRDIRVRNAPY